MENLKHTPGPWKATEYLHPEAGKRQFYIDGPGNDVFLADVYDGNGSYPVEANARLIAKAWLLPEMETVLARILAWIDSGCDPSEPTINRARTLLAKLQED